MFKKIINLVPLFLLIGTAVQLFIKDFDWYSKVYYIYIYNFHPYGIFLNLYALYYSVNYAKSIISDISILGLICVNISTMIFFISNGGEPIDYKTYSEIILLWTTSISSFFIAFTIILLYFRKNNYRIF